MSDVISANRVREVCSASGTQNLTLQGAVSGFATFASKIQTGSKVPYVLLDGNGAAWECGVGTLVSAGELQRTTVRDSSSTEDRVNSLEDGTPIKVPLSTNQHTVFIGLSVKDFLYLDEDGQLANPSPFRATIFADTIADLTAMTGLADNETVFVKGAAAVGDGGGGIFYWDEDDATSESPPESYEHDTLPTGLFKRIRADLHGIDASGVREIDAQTADSVGGSAKIFFRKKDTAPTAWMRWFADYVSSTVGRARLGIRYGQASVEKIFLDAYSTGDNLDRLELLEPTVLPSRTNSNGFKARSLSWLSGVSRLAVARADAAGTGAAADFWEIPHTKGGFLSSVVPSVTALKALDAAAFFADGDRALVMGSATSWFAVTWSASSSATANDATVIRPTVGAAASGNGRWLRESSVHQGFGIDVRDYGASTANADNTTQFAAAAAAAVAAGLRLLVPAGNWDVYNWTTPAGLECVGAGKDKTFIRRKASAPSNFGAVVIQNPNTTFTGITFDGLKASQTQAANTVQVATSAAYNIIFRNCRFTGAKTVGAAYGGGLGWFETGDAAQDTSSLVENCDFDANDTDGMGVKQSWGIKVVNNRAKANGGSGFTVYNFDTPVEFGSNQQIVFVNNRTQSNTESGIVIFGHISQYNPTVYAYSHTTHSVIIAENQCYENSKYGIVCDAERAICADNICEGNGGNNAIFGGILFNAAHSICHNNICHNNAYYGIDAGGSYKCIVTENKCTDNGQPYTGGSGGHGISLGCAAYTYCAGNHLENNGDSGGGQQLYVSAVDGDGTSTGGFAGIATNLIIENNILISVGSFQVGLWLHQRPEKCIVRNNTAMGGDPLFAFIFEAQCINHGNHHLDYVAGYTIASAATLVVPDWVETALITGTTAITEIRTYSSNNLHQKVAAVKVTNNGSGWTSAPTVSFTGGGGTGAAATAYITNDGRLAYIKMSSGGSGYTSAPTVVLTGGGGTGVVATASVGCDNAHDRELRLVFQGASSIQHGNNIYLQNNMNFQALAAGKDVMQLRAFGITSFQELSRTQPVPLERFSAHKNNVNQTGIVDSTATQVTFGSEHYDVGSRFASNAWTPKAGPVTIRANLRFSGVATYNAMWLYIYKNGSPRWLHNNTANGAGGGSIAIEVDDVANGTDVYTVWVFMPTGGGTGTIEGNEQYTWFQGRQLP